MKIQFTPVGVSFDDVPENIKLLSVGSRLNFLHVPAFYGTGDKRKEYPNAIVVMFNGKKVGSLAESSLPESPQQSILRLIKDGKSPEGVVVEIITPKEGETFKPTYKIEVEVPEYVAPTDGETVMLKSFNEEGVVVEFNKKNHTYSYNGKQLTGATTFIKQFTTEFNGEQVAKACEKSWGVPAQDILNLWASSNEVSTEFGTLVHKTLEHYFKNRELSGKIMSSRESTDDPAMPKHPILRRIIEGFLEVYPYDLNVENEILVTDVKNGRCGQVDLLNVIDRTNKICRIEDFKVNIASEEISSKNKLKAPYDKLPASKLSKYQLQLNFYRQMMVNSGWKVVGMDIYVYEDGWKSYELEEITI